MHTDQHPIDQPDAIVPGTEIHIEQPIPAHVTDVRGELVGHLTIISYAGRRGPGKPALWHVLCRICGAVKEVSIWNLRSGRQRSCGGPRCKAIARADGERVYPAEVLAWRNLRDRCLNPRNPQWGDYGGRGVKVCDRWLDPETGLDAFLHDMGPRPSPKHSIERIDVNGDYEPENCTWATSRQQARNRRSNHRVGVKLTVAEAAERAGVRYSTMLSRLRRGWSVEDAIRLPVKRGVRYATRRA